jgi:hypothetical protein
MIKLDKKYKVTYAIDYSDKNPTIKYFDLWDEMQDWIFEEVANRVQWSVDHSPYSISEKELEELEEIEHSLIKIKEL